MKQLAEKFLKTNGAVSALLALTLFAILAISSPYFFSEYNLNSLQTSIAPYAIMCIGMVVLLISGVFDMSVGSVMCLGGLVSAICLNQGYNTFIAILLGLASGALVGLINGFLVEIAGVNALITTIGMMYIVRAICEVVLVGGSGFTDFPDAFLMLGRSRFVGVYLMFWLMLALVAVFTLYLRNNPGGRRLYYIGGNPSAARLMGIKIKKIRMLAFVLSGTMASLAGILVTARSGTANRYTGVDAHMDIIIACIIGGASLAGGQGSVVGALLGMIFMVLMSNAFNLFEVAPQWQSITVGLILLVVIVVDGYVSLSKAKRLGKI